jgi:hypothetical protein
LLYLRFNQTIMANITEKDIIAHLKDKIKFHEQEAKRIESILSAFISDAPSVKDKRKASVEAGDTDSLKGKPSKVIANKPVKAVKPLQIPSEYQPTLTLNGKIAYALSQISSGYGEDIAAKLVELQPELDKAKVTQQLSGVLSTLKKHGQLSAVKEGRKDRFSLVL